MKRRLGVSLDYTGNFLKLSGNDAIDFTTHRVNVSARFRTYFFEKEYGRLTVGARLSYHLFFLSNKMDEGVYNFTQVYGPSFGVFLEDPVLYRFWRNSVTRRLGFEGEFNYLVVTGGDDAPTSPEIYLGAYYDVDRYRFSLGYRSYGIKNDRVKESYDDIELGVGYRF
jgi:hypothetical protein